MKLPAVRWCYTFFSMLLQSGDYTHSGWRQIARRFTEGELKPDYSDGAIAEAVNLINIGVLLMTAMLLVRLALWNTPTSRRRCWPTTPLLTLGNDFERRRVWRVTLLRIPHHPANSHSVRLAFAHQGGFYPPDLDLRSAWAISPSICQIPAITPMPVTTKASARIFILSYQTLVAPLPLRLERGGTN
jgi:hypothetical protein